MREITFKQMMMNDLQHIRDWQFALSQMTEELETLQAEYATIKATDYDKMPGGSGDNVQEEKLLSAIAKRDQKQYELNLTRRRLADLERLLEQLSEEERDVIQKAVIENQLYEQIAADLHCTVRQVYNRKRDALAHLVRLRHGAAYHE